MVWDFHAYKFSMRFGRRRHHKQCPCRENDEKAQVIDERSRAAARLTIVDIRFPQNAITHLSLREVR